MRVDFYRNFWCEIFRTASLFLTFLFQTCYSDVFEIPILIFFDFRHCNSIEQKSATVASVQISVSSIATDSLTLPIVAPEALRFS